MQAHPDNEMTAKDLIEWLEVQRPLAGIAENVEGWDMPEDANDTSTPMRRPGFLTCVAF